MQLEILIIIFSGMAISLLIWSLTTKKPVKKKVEGMEELRAGEGESELPTALGIFSGPARPLALRLRSYFSRKRQNQADDFMSRFYNFLQKKILNAGSPGELTPEMFLGIIVIASFSLTLLAGVFAALVEMNIVAFCLTGFAMGLFMPPLWLNQVIMERHIQIQKSLPNFLDLLNLCLESGLDFTTAISRIVDRFSGTPIGYELLILQREIQMGRSRGDSLSQMGQRIGLGDMTTVINAIIQSERLGSSIGQTLRIQAAESRNRRTIRAEELALKAPVKLLFPLVAFIFPTTFIIIFAPIVISNLPVLARFGQ